MSGVYQGCTSVGPGRPGEAVLSGQSGQKSGLLGAKTAGDARTRSQPRFEMLVVGQHSFFFFSFFYFFVARRICSVKERSQTLSAACPAHLRA